MQNPFWEETYQDDSVSTFGMLPNATIVEFQQLFDKSWSILDVGCGDGKNALYLAEAGDSWVEAFDISENAINKLKQLATTKALPVNAWVQDLTKFEFTKPYNFILSFGTLHFVKKEQWKEFILKAKEYTIAGGIHIIQLFTNVLPASPDIDPLPWVLQTMVKSKSCIATGIFCNINRIRLKTSIPVCPSTIMH